jgi:DNA polymerase III subunit delta'
MARAPIAQEIEALPEADRLGEFPHPRATKALYGHETAERAMGGAVAGNRMHHAWLLTGPEGIGKATLAYRFARHLLAHQQERDPLGVSLDVGPETSAGRQVMALSHPSLLVIRRPYEPKGKRFMASITVDEVRRLRGFLTHTVDLNAWRVVIVDSADELNTNAANALLKSLEEPPPRTVFLLISSAPGRLLPTIRSRCRTFTLASLDTQNLKRAVMQAITANAEASAPGAQNWDDLASLTHGSPRAALSFIANGTDKLYAKAQGILGLLPKVDWAAVHTLSDELAGAAADQKFEAFYDLLLDLVRRAIRAEALGAGSDGDRAAAKRLIGPSRLAIWANAWETINAEKATAKALNLDRKALILATITKLEAAARS